MSVLISSENFYIYLYAISVYGCCLSFLLNLLIESYEDGSLEGLIGYLCSYWVLWTVRDDRFAEAGLKLMYSAMEGDPSWTYVKRRTYLSAILFIENTEKKVLRRRYDSF